MSATNYNTKNMHTDENEMYVSRPYHFSAPASVRGSSVGSAGAPQSTQPSSNPPPGHGPPSSARFYQREV